MAREPSRATVLWNEFRVLLYRLFGVYAAIRSNRFPELNRTFSYGRPWLCEAIRERLRLRKRCDACESGILDEARKRPVTTRCFAGLELLAFPVRTLEGSAGQVLCAPVRFGERPLGRLAREVVASMGRASSHPHRPGLKEVEWFLGQVPVFRPRRRASLAAMAGSFFNELVEQSSRPDHPSGFELFQVPVESPNRPGTWLYQVEYNWLTDPESSMKAGAPRRYHAILYATMAPFNVTVPGRPEVRVRRGEVLFLPAGIRYRVNRVPGQEVSCFGLFVATNLDLSPLWHRTIMPRGLLRANLERLVEFLFNDYRRMYSVEGRQRVLDLLVRFTEIGGRPEGRIGRPPLRTAMQGVAKAKTFLAGNLGRRVGLGEVARQSGINKFSLIRLFRTAEGVTPGEYHRQLRLAESRKLLGRPEESIKSVARQVGFRTAESYCRSFKAWAGVSPSGFRSERNMPIRERR